MDFLNELPDGVNYDLIENGLFLGNLSTAVSIPTLTKLKISHILTVASEPLPDAVIQQLPHVKFLYINVDDIPGSVLLYHFESSCKFIAEAQAEGGCVLVHCYFGVSRSATLVAAHLMKRHKLDTQMAIDRIKARRDCVGPNIGFLYQLDVFYLLGWTVDSYSMQTAPCRLYEHQMLCARVRTEPHRLKEFLADYLEKFKGDPSVNRNPGLTCRSCRTVVCSRESVLAHRQGCWPALHKTHPSKHGTRVLSVKDSKHKVCQKTYYLTVQPWMQCGTYTSKMAGTILCPKCGAQLGRYHWLKDLTCACHEKSPCKSCVANTETDTAHFSVSGVATALMC